MLYNVETRALKQSVKRNIERFPSDFMFSLTKKEVTNLVSQNVIPSWQYVGGSMPYVFTERGVAMLSSVRKSKKAIEINIAIMRAFVKLRNILGVNKELSDRIDKLEKKYDKKFQEVFEILKYLIKEDEKPKEPMGFITE